MAEDHRRLEIGGTVYARRVQRTGLNTDAKRLLLTHAFEALGCQCVPLRTDTLNRQSQRAIERLRARPDGVLRGPQVMPGPVRLTGVYSIPPTAWPGVRPQSDSPLAPPQGAFLG